MIASAPVRAGALVGNSLGLATAEWSSGVVVVMMIALQCSAANCDLVVTLA
jgi:hypothetical protein